MITTLTITSKGQTTLPVALRRKLGLSKEGGVLYVELNEKSGEATISKPLTIEELSSHVSRHIKSGTTPVDNVDEYYQAHRKPRV